MNAFQTTKTGFQGFPELTVQSGEPPRLRLVDETCECGEVARAEFTRGLINTASHASGSVELRLTETQLFITFEPKQLPELLPPKRIDEEIIEAATDFLRDKGLDPVNVQIVLEVKPSPPPSTRQWPTDW